MRTMSIGVRSAIKTFNWLGTIWNGKIQFTTSMLFAIGFVSLFVTGGLSGLFLAQPTIDLYFHDGWFVVAHFHFVMGVASHLLSSFSRKSVFGYRAIVYALCGIGFLGFCVWGHHMFVSGMSPYSAFAFSLLTMSIGVPSAIKTFNWLGTLWGGKIQFTCAMLLAIGFVSLSVSGGVCGLFLAQPSIDLFF